MTWNSDVRGPDVSLYQDDDTTPQGIDFAKMRSAGASFVIIRVGQNTWKDPDFTRNYKAAKAAGLPRGVYWFYDSRSMPEKQAALCFSLACDDEPELGFWLDLEEDYNGPYKGWQNYKKFLLALQARTKDIGIYTGPYYWMTHRPTGQADLDYFKAFPLWIAKYECSIPIIPSPWTFAVLWQIGTPPVGEQYGAESKEIDMNWWNGSKESFLAFFGLTEQPETETEGTSMSKYYKWTAVAANIRSGPGSNYADKGDLVTGDVIQVDSGKVGTWFPYKMAQHSNGTWVLLANGTPLEQSNQTVYYSPDSYFVEVAGLPKPITEPPVEPPPDTDEIFVSVDCDITATVNGTQYHGVVMIDNVQLKPVE